MTQPGNENTHPVQPQTRQSWAKANEAGQVIPLLQEAQGAHGYISPQTIADISRRLGVPEAEIFGVTTFYTQFRLKPLGKFLIRVCDGTACHVNGAKTLMEIIVDELALEGGDTTADGLFTLQRVACLGCCSLAPVIMINDQTFGRLSPQKVRKILRQYRKEGQKTLNAQEAGR